MNIDVFTLFPGWFQWFAEQRHVRNAIGEGLELDFVDIRATTPLRAGQVDDTPYGGGAGMVLRVDVVEAALRARYGGQATPAPASRPRPAIAAWWRSPRAGGSSTTRSPPSSPSEPAVTLLCGRYEGFDERVNTHLATDVVSIGPYVLAGGELAAMVVCDALIRKLPGALGHADSAVEESFSEALEGAPEYPHYTRPVEWHGQRVPDVLLSGDHARVAEWRREQSRERGRARRPPTERAPIGWAGGLAPAAGVSGPPECFATIGDPSRVGPAAGAPSLCNDRSNRHPRAHAAAHRA